MISCYWMNNCDKCFDRWKKKLILKLGKYHQIKKKQHQLWELIYESSTQIYEFQIYQAAKNTKVLNKGFFFNLKKSFIFSPNYSLKKH